MLLTYWFKLINSITRNNVKLEQVNPCSFRADFKDYSMPTKFGLVVKFPNKVLWRSAFLSYDHNKPIYQRNLGCKLKVICLYKDAILWERGVFLSHIPDTEFVWDLLCFHSGSKWNYWTESSHFVLIFIIPKPARSISNIKIH